MSTKDISVYKNEDLVLKISSSIDPAKFDMSRYEGFLDVLCGTRDHQKVAIRNVCNYLLSQRYSSQADLAKENWASNPVLRDKYSSLDAFRALLPFADKLAATVDHATGTGKSFVIYGVARILLAEGAVDNVLVLCPSPTIEIGLTEKFRDLGSNPNLTAVLPDDAVVSAPEIINGTQSITQGSICVENIHATYKATKSSIRDCLGKAKGQRTLVLNDEVHHVFSPDARDEGLKKWKEFVADPEFGFKYVVGFSGTCYIGNEYLRDVIARYSLSAAIEDRVVKSIEYVAEDSSGDQFEKFQKIFDNHKDNAAKHGLVRPLTILVTKDISHSKDLADELIAFLAKKMSISVESAREKVLVVTSDKAHAGNVRRLRAGEPDDKKSKIEWIVSVSMLTEGWDVKNVFQIVPHEERAFNSKLLISQVLGRGLRVPPEYTNPVPRVIVFNHDRWSTTIKHLVDEVLEQERRIASFPMTKEPDYNFTLHRIAYDRAEDIVETEQAVQYNFKDFVELAAQARELERETVYEQAVTGQRRTKKTKISFEMIPVEHAVADVFNKFKAIDLEEGTSYAKKYTKTKIRSLIRKSLDRIGYEGNDLSKENRQRILSAFGNLNRAGNKSIRYKVTPRAVEVMSTTTRSRDSVGLAMLRRTATVFYDDNSFKSDPELAQTLKELEDSEELGPKHFSKIQNSYHFKTALSVVLTQSEPERKFIKELVRPENVAVVSAWIKGTDTGFYEIEYSYSKGEYSRRAVFNPDLFLKVGTDIVVVEIKDDTEVGDPSPENRGKIKAARAYFSQLNELQSETSYHFCFLSPSDYDVFFQQLRDQKHMTYQSNLDVTLLQ